jgi:hypothetical protein
MGALVYGLISIRTNQAWPASLAPDLGNPPPNQDGAVDDFTHFEYKDLIKVMWPLNHHDIWYRLICWSLIWFCHVEQHTWFCLVQDFRSTTCYLQPTSQWWGSLSPYSSYEYDTDLLFFLAFFLFLWIPIARVQLTICFRPMFLCFQGRTMSNNFPQDIVQGMVQLGKVCESCLLNS